MPKKEIKKNSAKEIEEVEETDGIEELDLDNMKRKELISLIKENKFSIKVTKDLSDEDLRDAILECIGDDEEEENDTETEDDLDGQDWSAIDAPKILELSRIATNRELKEYFIKEESNKEKELLHKHWEITLGKENDCSCDCASCITICNDYLSCFNLLKIKAEENVGIESEIVRPKNLDSVADVKMVCDGCYLADRCKHYKLHQTCVFDFGANIDFAKDQQKAYNMLINAQKERVMRILMFEKVDGGMVDKNVTNELQVLTNLLASMQNANSDSFNININAKRVSSGGESPIAKMMAGIFSAPSKQIEGGDAVKALPEKLEELPEADFTEIENEQDNDNSQS